MITSIAKRFFINANITKVTTPQELKAAMGRGALLVDFYADWCGPCKLLTPILEKVATSNSDGVQLVKVNVDQAPELASQFQISSVPTVILLGTDGEKVKSFVGARDEKFVRDFIKL